LIKIDKKKLPSESDNDLLIIDDDEKGKSDFKRRNKVDDDDDDFLPELTTSLKNDFLTPKAKK
jgi:hypothetical protein